MNGGETSAQDGGYVNNASMADKMKADAVLGKETMYDRADKMASGALNADSYNTDAYKQVLEDKLRSAGHLVVMRMSKALKSARTANSLLVLSSVMRRTVFPRNLSSKSAIRRKACSM